jgi:hypothetical protein
MVNSGRTAMADKMKGLEESDKKRTKEAKAKALAVINQLIVTGKKVNFSSIYKHSGISKSFLYGDEEIRARIEEQRACEVDNEMNRRAKYDKSSRSKDVVIEAKDKRIAKLEAENRKLHIELEHLRGLLYEQK